MASATLTRKKFVTTRAPLRVNCAAKLSNQVRKALVGETEGLEGRMNAAKYIKVLEENLPRVHVT